MWARWIYNIVITAALPWVAWRLFRRSRDNAGYRERPRERFGCYVGVPVPRSLWIHTVSVGEFIAARPLIDHCLAAYPGWPVVVTTTTPTGAARVRAAYDDRVRHHYLPYDLPGAIDRLLDHIHPEILVVMETELWPNLIHRPARRDIPVIIANARLSARSADGYARVAPLVRAMLADVTAVAAQAGADGQRFIDLGLPPEALHVIGSIKYDLTIDAHVFSQAKQWRARWGLERPVWIAASTHPGEDEQVLEAFRLLRASCPELLLVLVPRHPERFDGVALLLKAQGLPCVRHSAGEVPGPDTAVVLGDVMGQMMPLYAASDVAFVGGSLEPVGGHNMLEPLALGVPALSGPHVFNFSTIADRLTRLGVLQTVTSPLSLAESVREVLGDPVKRAELAARGIEAVDQERGALKRLCALLARVLDARGITTVPPLP